MVSGNSALTDPSRLVPLVYRADWTQLCLSAEIGTRIQRIRRVTISPGRDFWRPVTEYGPDDYDDDYRDDEDDDYDEDPRETWRLASAADAAEHTGPADEGGPGYPAGRLTRPVTRNRATSTTMTARRRARGTG